MQKFWSSIWRYR